MTWGNGIVSNAAIGFANKLKRIRSASAHTVIGSFKKAQARI
jgi:hypothetical protein